jgi:hypothetical protein
MPPTQTNRKDARRNILGVGNFNPAKGKTIPRKKATKPTEKKNSNMQIPSQKSLLDYLRLTQPAFK